MRSKSDPERTLPTPDFVAWLYYSITYLSSDLCMQISKVKPITHPSLFMKPSRYLDRAAF